jgi:hypothetical protein
MKVVATESLVVRDHRGLGVVLAVSVMAVVACASMD